mgnify:CR=1 FL=1
MRALRGPLQVPVLHGLFCKSEEELNFNGGLALGRPGISVASPFVLVATSQKATSSSDQSLLAWVETWGELHKDHYRQRRISN